jgi:hypothetical protein
MASTIYYPPIVKDYEPAFIAGDGAELKVYFNLSSLGTPLPSTFYVHASIIRKDGVQVVNLNNGSDYRYRATGTILNIVPVEVSTGYYYITLTNDDLKSVVDIDSDTYEGWIPGWTYKIQLRLSTVRCTDAGAQEAWLQQNSGNFTEWSTICFVKAIAAMTVTNYNFAQTSTTFPNVNAIMFKGSIFSSVPEVDEDYYSCRLVVYSCDNSGNIIDLIEDSGLMFNNEISNSYYEYLFITDFSEGRKYRIQFTYTTENDYTPAVPLIYQFTYSQESSSALTTKVRLATVENAGTPLVGRSSVSLEEDEGRVGLQLYWDDDAEQESNILTYYITRSSSIDNFSTWHDVKYVVLKHLTKTYVNSLPMIYDYTIESGVWYKYALQVVDESDERGPRIVLTNPVMRNFNYAYLLGYGGQQLKLEFDNSINNLATRVIDATQETIGGKYPFMSRNSNVYYKTFSIGALVSFNMDEQNTFLEEGKKSIYKYNDVVNLYNNYNTNNRIGLYDYIYERDFRNKVADFLYSGKPMLFKSTTEGNILVRLSDISFTPNQPTGRLIYSFSGNAKEIDDNTLDNYQKYGLFDMNYIFKDSYASQEDEVNHTHTFTSDTPAF